MNILTPMVGKLIRPNQTAFIKGRNILEGVVILHEVINEFKKSDKHGVLFKIDFWKHMTKLSGSLSRRSWPGCPMEMGATNYVHIIGAGMYQYQWG
jgi:hypothetical protein